MISIVIAYSINYLSLKGTEGVVIICVWIFSERLCFVKLRFKTPRISFFLYVVGDPRAIFVQKNVVLGMRRSLCESGPADSLELQISFIFLCVVRNSCTYTKTTICLIVSLPSTYCNCTKEKNTRFIIFVLNF